MVAVSTALGLLVGLAMLQRSAACYGLGARPGQDIEALLSALSLRLIIRMVGLFALSPLPIAVPLGSACPPRYPAERAHLGVHWVRWLRHRLRVRR